MADKKQFSNTKSIVKVETGIVTLISYHHYLKIVGNYTHWSTSKLSVTLSYLIWLLIVSFVKININNLFKKAIYKTRYKYFRSGIIYVQNWRVCVLLKCILAIQKQLTNRPQVITNRTDNRWTFGTLERLWNI
jgi:hypothetical protein